MNNQTTISEPESNQGILWLQVIALTVIQGAISLSWLVYRFFLPPLLTGFGFPNLAPPILILEEFLTIIDRISGKYSDIDRISGKYSENFLKKPGTLSI